MNTSMDLISYASCAMLPAYLVYLAFYSSTQAEKIAKGVVKNQQYFTRNRAKMRAWRISFLYETYKNELAISPVMNFCVEVNVGWFFAPRWRYIMVSPANSPKEMLEKFKKSDMGRLPRNLQAKDFAYAAGEGQAWKLALFLITAFPFGIEMAKAFLMA
jgi:hypothetical protein